MSQKSTFADMTVQAKDCYDPADYVSVHKDYLASVRDAVVSNVDMLQVDRLRKWADNLQEFGPDITYWGSLDFLIHELRSIADSIEACIQAVPPSPAGAANKED